MRHILKLHLLFKQLTLFSDFCKWTNMWKYDRIKIKAIRQIISNWYVFIVNHKLYIFPIVVHGYSMCDYFNIGRNARKVLASYHYAWMNERWFRTMERKKKKVGSEVGSMVDFFM